MSDPRSNGHDGWTVTPYSWRQAERLAASTGLPLVAAIVLAGRGITDPVEARMFLDCAAPIPDPFLFGGMEPAVRVLGEAVERRGRIVVHGDYDADGITATAVMLLALQHFGIGAEWYLPNRFNEGYGVSRPAVESIAAGGPAVLVTVDCGVNYPDEVALARSLGLEVIVVDHHQPGPVLPDCHVIHAAVGDYPHADLCGVGLALKVMHALFVHLGAAERRTLPPQLDALLDLVAIGTIADLAPLRGENRYYVKEGLKLIGIGHRVGLRALASVAACSGVADSGTVAYRLAPRLNAAGRLADPSPPLRLLLTEDEEEARSLAAKLHELNGARQDVERQILDQAVAEVEALDELPPALVLAGPQWHEGVVGIVASRLVERYHRPTILLGVRDGVAKGSGRSIPGYDLMAGLEAGARHLTVYGGHKQAVGLTLPVAGIDDFRRAVEEHAGACLTPGDLVPAYQADVVLRGEDVNADTALALASLGPFGTGNPRPRVLLVDTALQNAEVTRNGAHLRCNVEVDGVRARAIGFGLGAALGEIDERPRGRILGAQLRVDEWQGNPRPEFLLERIGAAPDGAVDATPEALGHCLAGCPYARWSASDGEKAVTGTQARSLQAAREVQSLPEAHDLRDGKNMLSGLAQVLCSGEAAVLLTCSVGHTLSTLRTRLPIPAVIGGLVCYGRGCEAGGVERLTAAHTLVSEWEVGERAMEALTRPAHVIALDPPFRQSHVALLRRVAEAGSIVHLCYGDEERQRTARLLRYLVHPRFAMVCVYRALQQEECSQEALVARAAELAWREAGVVLGAAKLQEAAGMLADLGIGRRPSPEAKLETRDIPAYAAAEAEYEECSRLCLSL
jgi:single-stranded-DNA-specific exonuclease